MPTRRPRTPARSFSGSRICSIRRAGMAMATPRRRRSWRPSIFGIGWKKRRLTIASMARITFSGIAFTKLWLTRLAKTVSWRRSVTRDRYADRAQDFYRLARDFYGRGGTPKDVLDLLADPKFVEPLSAIAAGDD